MNRKVYLDYNATSPVKHAVQDSMLSFFGSNGFPATFGEFGNPSSIHAAGRRAKVAIDDARDLIQAEFEFDSPEEFVFTGSGTESINTVIKGLFFQALKRKKPFHCITSRGEHEATLQSTHFIESLGAQVHWLALDRDGQISLDELRSYLSKVHACVAAFKEEAEDCACLVSLLAVNNETGVVTDMPAVAKLCREFGALLHIDAIQAPGKIPTMRFGNGAVIENESVVGSCDVGKFSVRQSGADFVSFSAHKIGGPKGVGGLYLRRGLKLEALLSGGAQERKRRAGTQNVAGIVGFGQAARILPEVDFAKVLDLRDRLEAGIASALSDIIVVGRGARRAINCSNLIVPGVRSDSLLMALDLVGVCVSAGSACNSGTINPSHVLLAMGFTKEEAMSGIRVSLGPETTTEDVDYFLQVLPEVIERIRRAKRS